MKNWIPARRTSMYWPPLVIPAMDWPETLYNGGAGHPGGRMPSRKTKKKLDPGSPYIHVLAGMSSSIKNWIPARRTSMYWPG
jgi:hypothetical protein